MFIQRLQDVNSDEYKEAKEQLGGWITGDIRLSGISNQDLSSLVLKFLANQIK